MPFSLIVEKCLVLAEVRRRISKFITSQWAQVSGHSRDREKRGRYQQLVTVDFSHVNFQNWKTLNSLQVTGECFPSARGALAWPVRARVRGALAWPVCALAWPVRALAWAVQEGTGSGSSARWEMCGFRNASLRNESAVV